MATPTIVSVRDFTSSRYAQLGEDLNLNDVLSRAESVVQAYLRYNIQRTEYVEIWRPTSQITFTKQRPILEVSQIRRRFNRLGTWSVLDPLTYTIESAPGYIIFDAPVRGYEIEVTYDAGYDPVPEGIKEAIIMQAVLLSFTDIEVYGAGDAKQPGILYMQEDIQRMLEPYRRTATVYH